MNLVFQASVAQLPEDAAVTAAYHATDEQRKKKDAEIRKKRKKAKVQLERGRQCQGSDEEDKEEEDEEEEEDGGGGVQWDTLANEDETTGSGSPTQAMGPFSCHEGEDTLPELTETDRPTPFKPSEQREGSKRPRADEA